jgi:hypothetical protein
LPGGGNAKTSPTQFIVRLHKNPKTHPNELGYDSMNNWERKFDASTVAIMRQAMDEVVADRLFLVCQSVTPLEVAEHILEQAASGQRDLNRLKSSHLRN